MLKSPDKENKMRTLTPGLLLTLAALAQTPGPKPIGTISELMIQIVYPTSDALFYVSREPPKDQKSWNDLQSKALMLAEAGNLLMTPPRARDDRWMADAKRMVDAGAAAFKAAKAKDMDAILALNDAIYTSCVTCHEHYRQGYGARRQTAK